MASRTDLALEDEVRQRIIQRMIKLDVGLSEVAQASGIELPTLQKMVDGTMTLALKYIRPLAAALRMPYIELFREDADLARSNEAVRVHDPASFKGWIRYEAMEFVDRIVAQAVELFEAEPQQLRAAANTADFDPDQAQRERTRKAIAASAGRLTSAIERVRQRRATGSDQAQDDEAAGLRPPRKHGGGRKPKGAT
jgi:hypothetical protein